MNTAAWKGYRRKTIIYAALAARVNRVKLITYATLFFIINLALFAVGGYAGLREGVVFCVWVGIFNRMVMAQFWASRGACCALSARRA